MFGIVANHASTQCTMWPRHKYHMTSDPQLCYKFASVLLDKCRYNFSKKETDLLQFPLQGLW